MCCAASLSAARSVVVRDDTLVMVVVCTWYQLRALGQAEGHEAKLMGEISQRVAELKQLNKIMQ